VGQNGDLLELAIGKVMGFTPYMHSIWIEEQFTDNNQQISSKKSG
jgi:hypothetical protein